jgi:hypothetical protein
MFDQHGLIHVGGVDEQLGGVDPWADENLLRVAFGI